MTSIELTDEGIRIDAAVLARAFGISTDDLKQGMREGAITSRFERGEGADAGTVRLIFFSPGRRVRITADESGKVLTCDAADFVGTPASGNAMRGAAASGAAGAQERGYAAHLDALLDLALEATFPASDPIAVSVDTPARTIRQSGRAR